PGGRWGSAGDRSGGTQYGAPAQCPAARDAGGIRRDDRNTRDDFDRIGGGAAHRCSCDVARGRRPPVTSSAATVRVAGGQGFWGDWLEAPYRQVTGGPVDYLMMDYLAEVTMSILQKQKARDPARGYATDFVAQMERILPTTVKRGIKVTANAGGVNPRACAM